MLKRILFCAKATFSNFYPYLGVVPLLINLRNVTIRDWIQQPSNVYIGRHNKHYGISSVWGNPFKISPKINRRECIIKYKEYLLNNEHLMQKLPDLCGKVLGCWCDPEPCHGHVIIKIIKEKLLL